MLETRKRFHLKISGKIRERMTKAVYNNIFRLLDYVKKLKLDNVSVDTASKFMRQME